MQNASISFDFALWEIFTALGNGACLVLSRPQLQFDGAYLVKLIRDESVTMMGSCPSILSLIIEVPGFECCNSLKMVLSGGEVLSDKFRQRFFEKSSARLINIYGPTETSISVLHWECSREAQDELIPIGFPVAGMQIYLLDEHKREVPVGSEGEVFIGGAGVSNGYHLRPALNRDRFMPDHFCGLGNQLYRSGDRARQLKSGAYVYLGREDNQIKIRGMRVEPEEVEFVLLQCVGVRDCVVAAPKPVSGNRKLLAYYVVDGSIEVGVADLRSELRTRLPEFMVPSVFLKMEELPMTPNGKIDRSRLAPVGGWKVGTACMPVTESEKLLVRLWSDILGFDIPDVTTDFFEMGGDSLTSLELSVLIEKKTSMHFPPSLVFEASTIRKQAELLDSGTVLDDHALCVPISTCGEGTALVLVSSIGGSSINRYEDLCKCLPGVRVVGVNSPLLSSAASDEDLIDAISQLQVNALAKNNWSGPFILAGFSAGGVIAFELAHKMVEAGLIVDAIVMFDTAAPEFIKQLMAERRTVWYHFVNALRFLYRAGDWEIRLSFLVESICKLWLRRPGFAGKPSKVARCIRDHRARLLRINKNAVSSMQRSLMMAGLYWCGPGIKLSLAFKTQPWVGEC